MADSLSTFLLVLIGLIVSFDTLGVGWPADLLAVGFVLVLFLTGVFKLLTVREEQRAPTR